MSRAFVKEPDGDTVADEQPELPVSLNPNHITRQGFSDLERELGDLSARQKVLKNIKSGHSNNSAGADTMSADLELMAVGRRIRYVVKRLESAIVFNPEMAKPGLAGFGATVVLEDEEGNTYTFTIVGEDEADPVKGLISWTSPLAKQLKDRKSGNVIRWMRPRGDVELEIISLRYDDRESVKDEDAD